MTREARKSGPGMRVFMRSVVANAAMKRLVVEFRRGFLNTTTITRILPTNDRIRSKLHVSDSRTTRALSLNGISLDISHQITLKTRAHNYFLVLTRANVCVFRECLRVSPLIVKNQT